MKFTNIEKFVIALIVLFSISFCFSVYSCRKRIENAGDIGQIIIDVGKEVKDIKDKIEEEEGE